MKSSPSERAGTQPVLALGAKFGTALAFGCAANTGPNAQAQRTYSIARDFMGQLPNPARHHIPSSAALAGKIVGHDELVLHPAEGKIFESNFGDLLEELEVMPLVAAPESDGGFERRTAGKIAGDLGNEDRGVFGELEALADPLERG